MLELKELCKAFEGPDGRVEAVKGVSLRVVPGEMVAVRGTSGCGKSTLLLSAGGLLRPDSGNVEITGEDVYSLSPNARTALRAESLGFVFQQFHLVPYLSILDNVLTPSATRPGKVPLDRARELIAHFGLESRANHVPEQLSTGERQRAALARALLNQPKLILADEPTGNLDEENGRAVLGYLAEFAQKDGAVLVVTHDAKITDFATRSVHMKAGELVEGE